MRYRRKSIYFLLPVTIIGIIFMFFVSRRRAFYKDMDSTSYDELGCGCPRQGSTIKLTDTPSLCSDWSTARGEGQKVIAYTLYGNSSDAKVFRHYHSQIEDRLKEANHFYEDWIVRLYHNSSQADTTTHTLLCRLLCQYPNFDPCHVNAIPLPAGWNSTHIHHHSPGRQGTLALPNNNTLQLINKIQGKIWQFLASFTKTPDPEYGVGGDDYIDIADDPVDLDESGSKKFGDVLVGKMWRFLPLGDDTVDQFLVRDIDSYILPREVSAVQQWLQNSSSLVHAMRDHPSHNGAILAGMWGAARWRDPKLMSGFLRRLTFYAPKRLWNFDQILLRRVIWPDVTESILVHDSYHCRNPFLQSRHPTKPFPTKRRGHLFVSWGPKRSVSELRKLVPCPVYCRPQDHLEWEYC